MWKNNNNKQVVTLKQRKFDRKIKRKKKKEKGDRKSYSLRKEPIGCISPSTPTPHIQYSSPFFSFFLLLILFYLFKDSSTIL